jgi:hypothetical protein
MVVDQNVHAAELRIYFGGERRCFFVVGQIRCKTNDCPPRFGANLLSNVFGFLRVSTGNND